MNEDQILFIARASGWLSEYESSTGFSAEAAIKFAKMVEKHVREQDRENALAYMRMLHDSFSLESAELRIHQWASKEKA